MPIINNKQVDTVKHEGKIFVLECNCIRRENWRLEMRPKDLELSLGACDRCDLIPWIILPKKEAGKCT